jgi:AAA domain
VLARRAYIRDILPVALPDVLTSAHMCKKCYVNRECIMYARAAESAGMESPTVRRTHKDLLDLYTGHLDDTELGYFLKWDQLIDLESSASSTSLVDSWLTSAHKKESEVGKCMSGMVLSQRAIEASQIRDMSKVSICFERGALWRLQSALNGLGFDKGCYVIVSTDCTMLENVGLNRKYGQMHVMRGTLDNVTADLVSIYGTKHDLIRIKRLCEAWKESGRDELHFRLDREELSVGTGTLRQNLIKLLSGCGRSDDELSLSNNDRRMAKLRGAIIHLRAPIYESITMSSMFSRCSGRREGIPSCDMETLQAEYVSLNSDQMVAVEKVSLHAWLALYMLLLAWMLLVLTVDVIIVVVDGVNVVDACNLVYKANVTYSSSDRLFACLFVCLQVMTARDFTVIQGLPGTGKTSTIAYVIRLLVAKGKRVLVTSYTHAAVDNIFLKLIERGVAETSAARPTPALIRIGSKTASHAGVHGVLVSEVARSLDAALSPQQQSDDDYPSAESLAKAISCAQIVGVTALSIPRSPLLSPLHFDVVVVDEAGQISQPAIIGALMSADSFVLVGDHMQLPPLVSSEVAEEGGECMGGTPMVCYCLCQFAL